MATNKVNGKVAQKVYFPRSLHQQLDKAYLRRRKVDRKVTMSGIVCEAVEKYFMEQNDGK
jgi:hypothetical protein